MFLHLTVSGKSRNNLVLAAKNLVIFKPTFHSVNKDKPSYEMKSVAKKA